MCVGKLKIVGDGQADLRFHGGIDKAILSYGHSRYEHWRMQMPDHDISPGGMGENLTVMPWTEDDVCIGDRWRIGGVVLEVSQPRQPCWKISRRWQNKLLTKWVAQTGYGGWYHRVVVEGTIAAGDPIELADRPHPNWSIARANDFLFSRQTDASALWDLMNLDVLADAWKRDLG